MRDELLKKLYANCDIKYKEFNSKIANSNKKMIGVRIPVLRKMANDISKEDYLKYLNEVKDEYFEEVMIEGFVISKIKVIDDLIDRLDKYTLKIDSWALCDSVITSCKNLENDKDKTLKYVNNIIKSKNVWRQRTAFVILLCYFIKKDYLDIIFKYIEDNKNNFYYVMMSKAWLISECFVKYPKETLVFLNKTQIDKITYNKAISKICDSYRVDKNTKKMLKLMKR